MAPEARLEHLAERNNCAGDVSMPVRRRCRRSSCIGEQRCRDQLSSAHVVLRCAGTAMAADNQPVIGVFHSSRRDERSQKCASRLWCTELIAIGPALPTTVDLSNRIISSKVSSGGFPSSISLHNGSDLDGRPTTRSSHQRDRKPSGRAHLTPSCFPMAAARVSVVIKRLWVASFGRVAEARWRG